MRLDPDTAQILEIAGSWLPSIGTLATVIVPLVAAIVPLWLARKERRIQLKIWAECRQVADPVIECLVDDYIVVSVTNRGSRLVTITSVSLQCGFFRKRCSFPLPEAPLSNRLPVALEHSQKAEFFIPINQPSEWWEKWYEHFTGRLGKLRLGSMKFWVKTTARDRPVKARVETSIRKQIAAHLGL